MICANCRHDSDDDANYCRICGQAFDDDATEAPDVEWGEHVFFPKHGWTIAFFVLVVFVFGLLAFAAML